MHTGIGPSGSDKEPGLGNGLTQGKVDEHHSLSTVRSL